MSIGSCARTRSRRSLKERTTMEQQTGSPGEVWDAIVASSRLRTSSSSTTASAARCRLSLTAEPHRTHLMRLHREMSAIAPGLRDAIRELVSGEAPWPLFLHGDVGAGKSCAALCVLDHAGGDYLT